MVSLAGVSFIFLLFSSRFRKAWLLISLEIFFIFFVSCVFVRMILSFIFTCFCFLVVFGLGWNIVFCRLFISLSLGIFWFRFLILVVRMTCFLLFFLKGRSNIIIRQMILFFVFFLFGLLICRLRSVCSFVIRGRVIWSLIGCWGRMFSVLRR